MPRPLLALAAILLLALGVYWWRQSRDPRRIATRTLQSVVVLEPANESGQATGLGTGFFIAPDVIATNLHVVEGAWTMSARTVLPQTTVLIEGILGIDRANDVALLKALHAGQSLSLVVEQPDMGATVYVVGNPRGLEGSFSAGVVSAVRREGAEAFIQITAPISPGSSGSPVLDEYGHVVGIAAASVRGGQNLNLAIPAQALSVLLQSSASRPSAPLYEATLGAGRARERARLRGPVRSVTLLRVDVDGSKAYAEEPERLLTLDDACPALDEHRDQSGRTGLHKPECKYIFDLLGNLADVTDADGTRSFRYNGGSLASYTDINDRTCLVSYPSEFVEVHKCFDQTRTWGENMERTFDSTWHLIEERREYLVRGRSGTVISSFAYDSRGCMTKLTSRLALFEHKPFSSQELRKCDSNGDPTTINERVEDREVRTNECSYDRDGWGNWRTRTCRQTGTEAEITRRVIEYFGEIRAEGQTALGRETQEPH